jgi:predicted 2-oxoglutarate/Fe(II)-dependent dioxygenase YbiX
MKNLIEGTLSEGLLEKIDAYFEANEFNSNEMPPAGSGLAGRILHEYIINDEELQSEVLKEILPIVKKFKGHSDFKYTNVMIEGATYVPLWANFQNANEYNPPHNHTGNVSFVFYTKVPNLKRSLRPISGKKPNLDGKIGFIVKEGKGTHYITPKRGKVVVFNSDTLHFVNPFTNPEVRISISGNLEEII